jgi:hypothetical protein
VLKKHGDARRSCRRSVRSWGKLSLGDGLLVSGEKLDDVAVRKVAG